MNIDKVILFNIIGFNKYFVLECNKGDIYEFFVVCCFLLINNIRN